MLTATYELGPKIFVRWCVMLVPKGSATHVLENKTFFDAVPIKFVSVIVTR